ncbi:MAG: VWA domain-containing protein, partial [Pseudomonadales bacterium]|nr:VWA domain-containing protein [Pseudomonadales bacterium]
MTEFISNFHFLRPDWLWFIIPSLIIPWLISKGQTSNSWQKVIAPEFLQYLNVSGRKTLKSKSGLPLMLFAILIALALAGPTWQKTEIPARKSADNLVVLLDLSLSMYAEDLQPSRLIRAKQKLQDLLKLRREGNTALIVYAGDAHSVTPLTDDVKTIELLLSDLEPMYMPEGGSEPGQAVRMAKDFLSRAPADNGRILLITDEIAPDQVQEIIDLAGATPIDVLGVGTTTGAPIIRPDNGQMFKYQGKVV